MSKRNGRLGIVSLWEKMEPLKITSDTLRETYEKGESIREEFRRRVFPRLFTTVWFSIELSLEKTFQNKNRLI